MQRNLFICFIFATLLMVITGCGREVLEVELPQGEPKLMVEGSINNLADQQVIKLSWSTSFNSQDPVYEPNAMVKISDTEGNITHFTYRGMGQYGARLEGKPGLGYHLQINLNGEEYTAVSTMPLPAEIDSVSYRFYEKGLIREEGYYASIHSLDPFEEEGYYRWLIWVNDSLKGTANSIPGYFATHQLNKDNTPLSLQYPDPLKKGDKVRFHTIKMDRNAYTYYQGVLELLVNDGGLLGPVPVNPAGNISGNALGIFQATAVVVTEFEIE